MIHIEIKGDIAREDTSGMLFLGSAPMGVCSVESIRQALESSPDDPEVYININSFGGQVDEGLAIYDVLRTSGKNIHTNIVGACHSMAVVILLAAPFENRTANPNARALIHKVSAPSFGPMTADEALEIARYIAMSEDSILNIYQDRTGQPRYVLERLMDEERMHGTAELLDLGFISKINAFNTNSAKKMSKNSSNTSRWAKFLANARNAVRALTVMNYDYTDADGKVLFRTDGGPDEVLKVGTVVEIVGDEDSGTFILGDGRKVTIEDNVVVDIEATDEDQQTRDELENLVAEGAAVVQELSNRNAYLEAENRRLTAENASLRSQVRSTGDPRSRIARPSTVPANRSRSVEDIKAQVRGNIAAMRTANK